MDVKLYFHAKDQFLDLSGRMGYKIRKGDRIESQITVKDVMQLEFKQIKNIGILTTSGFVPSEELRKCSHDLYDKCMYSKLANAMKEETEDKCTVPWILNSTNICTKNQDIEKAFSIGWNRITNQKEDCHTPCHTILINVGAMNRMKLKSKDHAKVYAYFSSRVTQSEEHYFYTALTLLAQLGGYVGLFRSTQFLLDLCQFSRLRQNDRLKHSIESRRSRRDGAQETQRSDPEMKFSSLANRRLTAV